LKVVNTNVQEAEIMSKISDVRIKKAEVVNNPIGFALNLTLEKGSSKDNVSKMKVILDNGKESYTYSLDGLNIGTLETKVVSIPINSSFVELKSISLVPVYTSSSGKEVLGNIADVKKTIISDLNGDSCFDKDGDNYNSTISGAPCTGLWDCNDNNRTINPLADDSTPNLIDENCNGIIDDFGLVLNGGAELNIDYFGFATRNNLDKFSGSYSFNRTSSTTLLGMDLIPIDQTKTYTLSGKFKSAGTAVDNSSFYFGLAPYDLNQMQIYSQEVNPRNNRFQLHHPVSSLDTSVNITGDCSTWFINVYGYIAFGARDDFSDLPNRNLSGRNISSLTQRAGYCEVGLGNNSGVQSRARVNGSAGTWVREQASSSTYDYTNSGRVPKSWTPYSANKRGIAVTGFETGKFWPGTKYVKILILANYVQNSDYNLFFDDISLRET
jgi:hypothetical protein